MSERIEVVTDVYSDNGQRDRSVSHL